jgi:DNA-binding transcriptional MerR regulator
MSRDNLMGQYSIKQLEKISGVKAHTIRIWESRYNILVPNRTSTNIRYYNDEQLKKLLNISLLINKGSKISKLSNLTEKEIHSKVEEHLISPLNSETVSDERINALFISMIDFDEVYFDKIFSDSVLQIGFSKTIINLIYPFLAKR